MVLFCVISYNTSDWQSQDLKVLATVMTVCLGFSSQDDSRPPLYEETAGGRMDREGDSSEDEEEDGPPPEPTRFGWVQGVMVGLIVTLMWFLPHNLPTKQTVRHPDPRCGTSHLQCLWFPRDLLLQLTDVFSQIRCMLNIWGVILYLRLPWITAQAGVGMSKPNFTLIQVHHFLL